MKIFVTYGVGEGLTEIASFDSALWDSGIANFNLITLTSVIPKNSKIILKKLKLRGNGEKLYVVLSKAIEKKKGKKAVAALAWSDEIFVEHHGEKEKEVKEKILKSFKSLKHRKKRRIKYKISSIECKGNPVCAIVCAVFKKEKW